MPSMALKRNNGAAARDNSRSLLFGCFWLLFIFLVLFMVFLIGGLLSYADWETVRIVLLQKEFHFAMVFTLWTSVLATGLAALFAIPSAYVLSRYKIPGKAFVDTLVDIPIVMPPLVSGIALLILLGPILGDFLTRFGLEVVFSQRGVVVAQWFIATPYAVKIIKQAFDAIDPRMENIGRTLGFSPGKVFVKVTLPLAKNGIISGLIMTWTRTIGEFGATAMLAGITRMKTETLSVAIFLNMSMGDLKFAISTAIVMLLIALVALITLKLFLGKEVRI